MEAANCTVEISASGPSAKWRRASLRSAQWGSGAAAECLASRRNIEIVCVTNSSVQADICRRKFAKLGGRGQTIVTDFDSLDLPSESFDAIYALESVGYTKTWTVG